MRTTERPTLRDVARHAGVSTMTVSNVVNARRGKVSPTTTARVMASIELIGYVPNRQARALASQSSGLVALIYPPAPPGPDSTNQRIADLVAAIEATLGADGRNLMLRSATDVAPAVFDLRSWSIDGAIVLGLPPVPETDFKVPVIWADCPPIAGSNSAAWYQAIADQAEAIVATMIELTQTNSRSQVQMPPLAV